MTVCVGIVAVDVWWEGVWRWELGVFAIFIHEDYTSVLEECHECIFGTGNPADFLNGSWVDDALFVSYGGWGETCLLRRMYFWEKHSNQIISPVEKPMMTSM